MHAGNMFHNLIFIKMPKLLLSFLNIVSELVTSKATEGNKSPWSLSKLKFSPKLIKTNLKFRLYIRDTIEINIGWLRNTAIQASIRCQQATPFFIKLYIMCTVLLSHDACSIRLPVHNETSIMGWGPLLNHWKANCLNPLF